LRWVRGTAVFIAAVFAEALVFYCYAFTDIAFLWYIFIGCLTVIGLSLVIQPFTGTKQEG
jgi:hypothetical protein